MRIPSGVPGFDALVQGGLPSGASVIVQGPSGPEKDSFLFQFVLEGLRRNEAALVVLSSSSPARFQADLRGAGIDVERAIAENRLRFVDWFAYKEEAVQDVESDGPTFRASIDLTNVGIAISRAIAAIPREGEKRAAVEVLSPALSVYDLANVYAFAQSTKAKLDRFGFTSLFVIEKEMHDERTLSSLHQPFDGVVDIERIREGDALVRKVAVLSLKGTAAQSKYVPLELGPDSVLRVSDAAERERTLRRQEELIKSNPKDPKIWIATARNLRAMGENERALKCAEAALNIDPTSADAWRFKAETLDALGRHAEAERARRQSEVPPPKKEDPATRLLKVAEQRLQQTPNDADALFVKAAALAKGEDLARAIETLETLAIVDDTYPGLWVLKAKLHARRGEREKAQEARVRSQQIEKRQEHARAAPETTFQCPECGAPVREEDSMCPSCGVLFEVEGIERPPARPAPPPKPKRELGRSGLTNGLVRELPRGTGRTNGLVNGVRGRTNGTRGRTNGLVNGTKGRTNGLVNGTRGRTNGLVNGTRGRTNGLVNGTRGRTNGLVNGTRGRTNGTKGHVNGLTNGLSSRGTGATNGLVNGLLALRAGMTNGLTNGSGFTNGLGSVRLQREARVRRWKLFLIPGVSVILLLSPLLGPVLPGEGGFPITIDGDFADWAPLVVLSGGVQTGISPNIDLIGFGVADNVDFLAFYFEVSGTALAGGGSPRVADAFFAFIDVDRDPSTGYRAEDVGADRMVEVTGWGGQVTMSRLWEWDTNRASGDWGGWIKAATIPAAAVGGSRIEASIRWTALAPVKQPMDVVFHSKGYDGSTDTGEYGMSTTAGSVRILETAVVPEVIVGTNTPMVRLDLSVAGRPVSYDTLTVEINGTAPLTSVSTLRLQDGLGGSLGIQSPTSTSVTFQFSPRSLSPGQSDQLFVFADASGAAGSTLGVRLGSASALGAGDAAVTLARSPAPRALGYLGSVPTSVVIDGAFSEWTVVSLDAVGEPGVPSQLDIAEYAFYLNAQQGSVYLRVTGPILAGALVPAANPAESAPGPGPGPVDTDRDTVPDSIDLFPTDFNNDGIPDSASGGDYDGDGILDYPAGPDWYLNTTIPATFPAPYANTTVSVYIGPTARPVTRGEDIARVFLDADNSTSTGFRVDAIGADYLAEVRGVRGVITSQSFSAFAGGNQLEWAWSPVAAMPAATDSSRLEFAFDVSGLGVAPDARAFFDLRDWSGRSDPGQPPSVRVDTRSSAPPGTRDISGNEKWFFRDTSTTGTGCTTNRAASTTAGASAATTVLTSTQSICWFTTLGLPSTTVAGPWEVILDIDKTTDATHVDSPNANGDTNAWSAAGCTEANEYLCVDETTNDGDTTYIVSNASVATDSLYNFPNWASPPSPLSVVNVIVEASCRKVAGGSTDVRVIVKSGSTTGVGGTSMNCPNSPTYTVWTDTWTTDPADGSAWTLSDLDGLQIGVRDNDGTTREARVSHVKVTITFLPVYSVEIDKCTVEDCTSLTTLYGPTNGNTYGSDATFTTGSIGAQTLGANERFRFRIRLETTGSVTIRYNGANPGTDDSRATIPIPEFGEAFVPIGFAIVLVWVVRRRARRVKEGSA